MREKRDKESVAAELEIVDLAAVGIDQKGDLLEGEKADRKRQEEGLHGELESGELVDDLDRKDGILVVAEEGEVTRDPGDEEGLAAARPGRRSGLGARGRLHQVAPDEVVKPDRAEEQRQVGGFPPAIEKQ